MEMVFGTTMLEEEETCVAVILSKKWHEENEGRWADSGEDGYTEVKAECEKMGLLETMDSIYEPNMEVLPDIETEEQLKKFLLDKGLEFVDGLITPEDFEDD